MTLTFVTNFVNHHQLPLADEFYKIMGEDYTYIACEPFLDWLKKDGYALSLERPLFSYILERGLSYAESNKNYVLI